MAASPPTAWIPSAFIGIRRRRGGSTKAFPVVPVKTRASCALSPAAVQPQGPHRPGLPRRAPLASGDAKGRRL